MSRFIILCAGLACLGLALFWTLTRPNQSTPDRLAALVGDADRGSTVFAAGGCASCHAAPNAEGDDKAVLSGGLAFSTAFGTFYAPNISPDLDAGIGGWSTTELADAMQHGVSPNGDHYYPAFPYASYIHASDQDVVDLSAFLFTLPASQTPNRAHDVSFPFNIRRGLGLWKLMFVQSEWVAQQQDTPELIRGRYLVEGLGHCAECHTPRNALGGLDRSQWLRGAPSPDGKGKIPALTPDALDWSAKDIAYYLETGFTPDFDSAGGEMVDVIENMSKLSATDRNAIAAYLKTLPSGS
ncbi:MAG: cytochrome c [Paracoccaceae bacterium]